MVNLVRKLHYSTSCSAPAYHSRPPLSMLLVSRSIRRRTLDTQCPSSSPRKVGIGAATAVRQFAKKSKGISKTPCAMHAVTAINIPSSTSAGAEVLSCLRVVSHNMTRLMMKNPRRPAAEAFIG